MEIKTPFALGGKRRKKDRRDYHPDSFRTGSAMETPASYFTPVNTIYSQQHKPACGAHMEAGMINTLFGVITSPEMAWDEIKLIDGYKPEDGTSFPAIMKEATDTSICDLTLLANHTDDSVSLLQYSDAAKITQAMKDNAVFRRISGYAYIDNPTLQQIKDNIFRYKVVGLLLDCGDGWWIRPDGMHSYAEKDILPLRLGTYVGGHFVYAHGFDGQYIYFVNSWDTTWGRGGVGYFDSSYLPHIRELGIMNVVGQYVFNKNLYFGMVNDPDVHALQTRLNVTPNTGNFGPKTFAAVRKFQKENGIVSTGFVGPLTRHALNII